MSAKTQAMKPTRKVAAGGVAGAVALLIVFVAGEFGLEIPPEVASAVTVLLTAGVAWLKRDESSPDLPEERLPVEEAVTPAPIPGE